MLIIKINDTTITHIARICNIISITSYWMHEVYASNRACLHTTAMGSFPCEVPWDPNIYLQILGTTGIYRIVEIAQ